MAKKRSESDEKYVLDLVAETINEDYQWQRRFDTLLGDPGKRGRRIALPVDAYFPEKNLIVEYREKQHSQSVSIMDMRMTISGVLRCEQRKIYDRRKEEWAVDNKVLFMAVSYCHLNCKSNGKLQRTKELDMPRMQELVNKLTVDIM